MRIRSIRELHGRRWTRPEAHDDTDPCCRLARLEPGYSSCDAAGHCRHRPTRPAPTAPCSLRPEAASFGPAFSRRRVTVADAIADRNPAATRHPKARPVLPGARPLGGVDRGHEDRLQTIGGGAEGKYVGASDRTQCRAGPPRPTGTGWVHAISPFDSSTFTRTYPSSPLTA